MCGILGILTNEHIATDLESKLATGLNTLSKRGPDFRQTVVKNNIALGHARLSIIDTSDAANQPMFDPSERYGLVFNGEIFNYLEIKKKLITQGVAFTTSSDTEVLLHSLIENGLDAINELNGFFAFCFVDYQENTAIIARDRFGIKPLVYSWNESKLQFASEIKALLPLGIKKDIDKTALSAFFKFNYIPAPYTIFEDIKKLNPGEVLQWSNGKIEFKKYYTYHPSSKPFEGSYDQAKQKVKSILETATERRMIADVPLGSFLSGGIDSSIVSTIASKLTTTLNTFSIGFKDQPQFDETQFANCVAKNINSNHTVFSLSNDDFLTHFEDTLTYLDEPFADSSALNMYILSKETKKKVTVALSGDGADELFSGYNKHQALWLADQKGAKNVVLKSASKFTDLLPKSRNGKWSNKVRQISKYGEGLRLNSKERYLSWASFMNNNVVDSLVLESQLDAIALPYLEKEITDFNDYLYFDFNLVLEGDMLRKVDSMSMANSLEVRTPFLDYELVDFVFSLPSEFKIDKNNRKKILKDAFKEDLPQEIFNRGKKGFEIPLQNWFQNELRSYLSVHVFNEELIKGQGILNWDAVLKIKNQLYSSNPNEAVYNTWALLSFQKWYSLYL